MLPSRDSGCKVTAFSFIHKELRYFFFIFRVFCGPWSTDQPERTKYRNFYHHAPGGEE